MNKKFWFSLFFIFALGYCAKDSLLCYPTLETIAYPNFYDNPQLDAKMRTLIAPHLLPLDHPIKAKLDAIFSKSRVITNQNTLKEAGFSILAARPISFIIVAAHPEFPGYLFKLYLDSELRRKKGEPNWLWLTRRCTGAKKIKEVIKKKKLKYFTVPDKWLYILPLHPASREPQPQPVIIVETFIELAENSELAWKTRVKPKHLDELYTILKSGYGSIHVPGNIPYTKNRQFAFIDTESPKREVSLKGVKKYLSDDMKQYWENLVDE